jgi:hypothetical protein
MTNELTELAELLERERWCPCAVPTTISSRAEQVAARVIAYLPPTDQRRADIAMGAAAMLFNEPYFHPCGDVTP